MGAFLEGGNGPERGFLWGSSIQPSLGYLGSVKFAYTSGPRIALVARLASSISASRQRPEMLIEPILRILKMGFC